jgi:hypothetical protein
MRNDERLGKVWSTPAMHYVLFFAAALQRYYLCFVNKDDSPSTGDSRRIKGPPSPWGTAQAVGLKAYGMW